VLWDYIRQIGQNQKFYGVKGRIPLRVKGSALAGFGAAPQGLAVVLVAMLIFSTSVSGFIPTMRDTQKAPAAVVFADMALDEFAFLGQFGDVRYYFREDRDILVAREVNGAFVWQTGLNAPFGLDLDDAIAAAETEEELRRVAEPRQERLNATWTALANSILTIEFFDGANTIQRVSSAARQGVQSTLMQVADGHFRLDVDFYVPGIPTFDLEIAVHIHLDETGITYNIFADEITGPSRDVVAALILTPFMGAVGGVAAHFDFETGTYGEPIANPMIPGYIFVPDGSGALMRFRENSVQFSHYQARIFGTNPAEARLFNDLSVGLTDRPHPLMPVFGVAKGNNQQAFVAWANEGAQYMEIVMMPHNNTTNFNFVYPRFELNQEILQVYNRRGDGFLRLFPQPREFNISMRYEFLQGDQANYVGMARAYREHLVNSGVLTPNQVSQGEPMPLRVDFIMSDVRRGILRRTNMVTTTIEQVDYIVNSLLDGGISSLNIGLKGFQNGGITTGRPWDINFTRAIGTRRQFSNFFDNMDELGVDASFMQDFHRINGLQMNLSRNQAFHLNRWGLVAMDSFEPFLPVNQISFARPARSAAWIEQQGNRASTVGAQSMTVGGVSNHLTSHWGRQDPTDARTSIGILQGAFRDAALPVNAVSPNQFLWQYTDRFLLSPVFSGQYMISTDTVPFLQMVLHNTMEVYAPYSNFSFFTQADILRMIDYNVSPSFVLTYQPAHLLASTNSLNFYSTEYGIYQDTIMNVYRQTTEILSQVRGLEWLDRQILAYGVVLNIYAGGVGVLINYTDSPVQHENTTIQPLSAAVLRGIT